MALLAESHISVHTWPELDYAAFDVFMCGVTAVLILPHDLKKPVLNANRLKNQGGVSLNVTNEG